MNIWNWSMLSIYVRIPETEAYGLLTLEYQEQKPVIYPGKNILTTYFS